jgi:hypothetical protein
MTIGTKSILYGAHCFLIHPFIVARAWWRLYGFPWHPLLWLSFFVHDLGYIGKPNMDGPEGKRHPFLGADIMSLFDREPVWHVKNLGRSVKTRHYGVLGDVHIAPFTKLRVDVGRKRSTSAQSAGDSR